MNEERLKGLRDRAELLHENLATLYLRNAYHFQQAAARKTNNCNGSCHLSVAMSADVAELVRLVAFENHISVSSVTEVALRELFQFVGTETRPKFLEANGASRRCLRSKS